jgi:hypothetical protein
MALKSCSQRIAQDSEKRGCTHEWILGTQAG